jgi:hypothetical protein
LARTKGTPRSRQRQLDRHVGHQRAHHAGHARRGQAVGHHHVEQFVAVEQAALASTICSRSASPSSATP